MRASASTQRGLTIVELMIGLVLGLLLLGGVLQIYLSSNQTYRSTEALSRIQENGRFALDFLLPDIREAGYKGACSRDQPIKNHLNTTSAAYNDRYFDLNAGIQGWEGSAGGNTLPNYRAGTDTILLKHAAVWSGVTATGNTPVNASTINVTAPSGIPQGAIMMISDANGCELFQKSNNANANTITKAGGGTPGNATPGENFSNHYTGDMEIATIQSVIYYISQRDGALPMLRRVEYNGGSVITDSARTELVEGVVDMQICYGVDTDEDISVDSFVKANAVTDWNDVRAARVTVVTVSPQENVATEAVSVQFPDCDGTVLTRTSADYPELGQRRLAQAFTSTIGLRNRLHHE